MPDAVASLRRIAASDGLPATVVIQPQLSSHGEVFVGLKGASELGPVVAFGLGGVFVEVLRRVSGRLAPLDAQDAEEMIAEFDDLGVADGFRGSPPWNRSLARRGAGEGGPACRRWSGLDRVIGPQPARTDRRRLRSRRLRLLRRPRAPWLSPARLSSSTAPSSEKRIRPDPPYLAGLEVISYDRRGHGLRWREGPASLEGDIQELLSIIGDLPATVIGHSLGGLVVLGAALLTGLSCSAPSASTRLPSHGATGGPTATGPR